jgi:hypothetical protein
MQVVVPSVSLAAVLQGAAFTVLVEIPSSATLSQPVFVPGNSALPTGGASPEVSSAARVSASFVALKGGTQPIV